MKLNSYLKVIVSLLVYLVVSLPVIFAQELNLQYDAIGNLVTGDGLYREYDGFNHLIRIRQGNTSSGNITEEFIWHPTEERVFIKKVYYNNGTLKDKIKYLNKNTVKIVNSSGTFYENYIYQEDTLVAQVTAGGQKQAVHSDHIGSTTLTTNSDGNIVENLFYSPYGEQLQTLSNSRYTFTGKEFDTINNEYNFISRRSKPEWANRLTTPDRIFYDFTKYETLRQRVYFEPQQLNPYTYANNNPYLFIDKEGNIAFIPIAIGFAIGFGVSVGYQYFTKDKVDYGQALLSGVAGAALSGLLSLASGTASATTSIVATTTATEYTTSRIGGEIAFDVTSSLIIEHFIAVNFEEEKKEEELPLCEKCYKRLQVDERGQAVIVTFNEKGQEVSRSSSGGGGYGGGSTVRETEDGRWVCNWCDDQGYETPIEQD